MNMIRTRILLFLALVIPVALSGATGTIKGKVTDQDGNPVGDVRITLSDARRGTAYVCKTDRKGRYSQGGIDPADYVMKLEKEGFLPLDGPVVISAGSEVVRNAVLAAPAGQRAKPEWEDADVEAKRLYKNGEYEDALKLYRNILGGYPELARIHFYAGNCLFHLERHEEALDAYREAVRLKADFFEAYTNLANVSCRLNRFDEALLVFEQGLAIHPESPALLSTAGRLYLVSGRSGKAVEYLERAASLDPDSRDHFYSLGIARAGQGDVARAIQAYEKFIALNADPAEDARVRGIVDRLKARQKK
jgi:tetratricopeptide (TPR) repeat protein